MPLEWEVFINFIHVIAPAGFWPLGPEAKTRGGTLGFPACTHISISKCKKVNTVSKFVVCGKNLDLIKLGAHCRLG